MIRLDRSGITVPTTWDKRVRRAFPDRGEFQLKTLEFESLDLDCEARRAGFVRYASKVLHVKRDGSCEFRAIWKSARGPLAEMSHHKCSYCESLLHAARLKQVEHFKPKSLFPSLVYDWNNYFVGCGACNGAKSDKWPMGGGTYLRPDEGDPEAELVFEVDGSVRPRYSGGAAQHTIQDLELDSEALRRARALVMRLPLNRLRDILATPRIRRDKRIRYARVVFRDLQDSALPYSAAVRQCFLRLWSERFPGVPL